MFQPKSSSDEPNTYSYHTWLLTTLPCILNSFQVPFLGLFWIFGGLRCSLSPAKHPQPTWAPCREGQWFQSLIPYRQSQFRTGYSHAPVCPELVRADSSTYGFKKHGISRLLSSFPLWQIKCQMLCLGTQWVDSWCEMLCAYPPCAPQGCCCSMSGIRVRMRQWGFPSPWACKALYHGQAALWPPNSELTSSPGWCQDEKQRLEDQMESLHLPPHSAGVFCMYKQREIWGMLPGQTGIANKTTQWEGLA